VTGRADVHLDDGVFSSISVVVVVVVVAVLRMMTSMCLVELTRVALRHAAGSGDHDAIKSVIALAAAAAAAVESLTPIHRRRLSTDAAVAAAAAAAAAAGDSRKRYTCRLRCTSTAIQCVIQRQFPEYDSITRQS